MVQPTKPLSLSHIHDVYSGATKTRESGDTEKSYKKTDRFTREPGHSGTAPNRSTLPPGRRPR